MSLGSILIGQPPDPAGSGRVSEIYSHPAATNTQQGLAMSLGSILIRQP